MLPNTYIDKIPGMAMDWNASCAFLHFTSMARAAIDDITRSLLIIVEMLKHAIVRWIMKLVM